MDWKETHPLSLIQWYLNLTQKGSSSARVKAHLLLIKSNSANTAATFYSKKLNIIFNRIQERPEYGQGDHLCLFLPCFAREHLAKSFLLIAYNSSIIKMSKLNVRGDGINKFED